MKGKMSKSLKELKNVHTQVLEIFMIFHQCATSDVLLYLCRELSDLETENEQMFVQLKHLQEKEKSCEELLERYK